MNQRRELRSKVAGVDRRAPRMVLKLSCPDRPGLVAAIAEFIASQGGNVTELSQFTDPIAKWFFLRVDFDTERLRVTERAMIEKFRDLAESIEATWHFRHPAERMPVAILVSKEAHCLHDLIARTDAGELPVEIRVILSNHGSLEPIAQKHGLPFRQIDMPSSDKESAFRAYREAIEATGAKLVVLARFMQILPRDFCEAFNGRLINIHHSFLPAFVGANPYRQAFERGVKIIGATAHYVTENLDAGPIIEQEVQRVEHYHTPESLKRLGRDCECLALSRAVRYHASDRVLIHGNKTIVFRD